MANFGSLQEIWQQSLELNIRYYSALSQLTLNYYKDLIGVLADLRTTPSSQPQPIIPPPPVTTAPSPQASVMVLEGETGGQALGVFLIANNLRHEVTARVVASPFVNPGGHTVQPAFTFDPEVIRLAPAEQLLVRVMTVIDDSLEPEVRYRGEFTIPELSGTPIPIILRRRSSQDKAAAETSSTASNIPQENKPSKRSRSRKTKRAENGGERKT